MGKTVGSILAIAGSAALIATGVGAAAGLALFGTTAGISVAGVGIGTLLTASSVLAAAGSFLAGLSQPKAAKPETTSYAQKQPIPPRVYAYGRSRLHPYFALFESTSDVEYAVDVYAFADGEADGVEKVYLADEIVTLNGNVVQTLPDKKYQGGNVKAGWTLGAATNSVLSSVSAVLPSIWTANHRGDGVVTGYLIKRAEKPKYFSETYPQGDNFTMSLVARWQKCFDPRTGQTAWTENPVLQLMHYYLVRRGYDYQRKFVPTLQYWIDAANICDEAVPLKAGGSEPRYRSCVTYTATSQPKEVVASLLETFDGWIAPRGDGALVVYAGKIYQPTVTIGPDDIISYRMDSNVEDENRVDQLTVSYVSADHDYNTVEAMPWGGENGARRTDAISPQSPSYSQNRRLAKRVISRANAPKRGNVTTNLGGRAARGQRYIYLDLREEGFDPFNGDVPVVEISSLTRDFQQCGVTFDWSLADLAIDTWNPATEEGEGAPVGDRIAPEPASAPVLKTATAVFTNTGGTDPDMAGTSTGVSGARLMLTATGPDRQDLTWYARWRTGTGIWTERQYEDTDPTVNVSILTEFVPRVTNLETQVSFLQGDGTYSPWSNSKIVNTKG